METKHLNVYLFSSKTQKVIQKAVYFSFRLTLRKNYIVPNPTKTVIFINFIPRGFFWNNLYPVSTSMAFEKIRSNVYNYNLKSEILFCKNCRHSQKINASLPHECQQFICINTINCRDLLNDDFSIHIRTSSPHNYSVF